MLPPEYLASAPDSILRLVNQVEEDILCDMARRIIQTGQLTATAQWQASSRVMAARCFIFGSWCGWCCWGGEPWPGAAACACRHALRPQGVR